MHERVKKTFPDRLLTRAIKELCIEAEAAKGTANKLTGKYRIAWTIIIFAPIMVLAAVSILIYRNTTVDDWLMKDGFFCNMVMLLTAL